MDVVVVVVVLQVIDGRIRDRLVVDPMGQKEIDLANTKGLSLVRDKNNRLPRKRTAMHHHRVEINVGEFVLNVARCFRLILGTVLVCMMCGCRLDMQEITQGCCRSC